MSTSKYIDKICCIGITLVLLLTAIFINAEKFGVTAAETVMGYEERLFDTSRVHTIDFVMDDWDGFIEQCENEEYELCSIVIDNEAYKNVGIRAKGNTSLSMVSSYGNDRYSFKVEFDHYDNGKTYYGLDKLSLNNIIQDYTYMKDYLTYQMMRSFQVSAPLCSYAYVTVNGEDWGLYLAVEGVEDSFLERNYGSDYGELYKPDSMDMGGGRGNGGGFDMDRFEKEEEEQSGEKDGTQDSGDASKDQKHQNDAAQDSDGSQENKTPLDGVTPPDGAAPSDDGTAPDRAEAPDGGMPGGAEPPDGGMPGGAEVPDGGMPDGAEPPDGGMPGEAETPDGRMPDGAAAPDGGTMPDGAAAPDGGTMPDGAEAPDGGTVPDGAAASDGVNLSEGRTASNGETKQEEGAAPDQTRQRNRSDFPGSRTVSGGALRGEFGGNRGGARGSSDVSLIYSDDEHDSYQNIFDNAKTDVTDSDKDRLIASIKAMNEQDGIEDAVDVEAVIRYFVVHNFVCNFDSYTGSMIHNYYLYEENGRMSMIPWDYNLAFGGFQSQTDAESLVNYPIDTPVSGGDTDSRPMLAWILNNEQYTEQYHQYFAEFIAEYFDSGYFAQMIDTVSGMIAPYVEKDPTKFCTYEQFETGVSTLKQFCLLRAESVRGQLDGTIPATADGQKQDASALVQADAITISDMGDMGRGMGRNH